MEEIEMYNEHYLIHKDDYIRHIEDKTMLYSLLKQLTHNIGKMKFPKKYAYIGETAKRYEATAENMFKTWGIPGSYFVFGDEELLAELMENELIAPEDAGYIPCEDAFSDNNCCDCCDCGNCPYADDENDREAFTAVMDTFVDVLHDVFGDNVTFHINIE